MTVPAYTFGSQSLDNVRLQNALKAQGVFQGDLDGIFGRETKAGVEAAQAKFGLQVTGIVDTSLLVKLGLKTEPNFFDKLQEALQNIQSQLNNPIIVFAVRLALLKIFPGKEIIVDGILATIKSTWLSKLTWGAVVGVLFNAANYFGHPFPPDVQDAVLTLGNSAVFLYMFIVKTYFTTSVTPQSAAKIVTTNSK